MIASYDVRMTTNAFSLAGISGIDDPELLRHRAAELTPDERAVEEYLQHTKAWFPYRRLDHMERTVAFVAAYDRVYLSMIDKNSDLAMGSRDWFKRRGHYLDPGEVMAPWARMKPAGKGKKALSLNPNWKHWLRARRIADKGMIAYDDFAAGALFSAIRRGWTRWPLPSQISSDKLLGQDPNDGYADATIPGFLALKYAKSMRITNDPYFQAAAWEEAPVQVEYLKHFARELFRVKQGDQAARRAWRGYQDDGIIPAGADFALMMA